jgi:PiT family inorganic phosphate transporter
VAVAVALALAYAVTNGVHDASNAIAALVATRAARPLPAVTMAAGFNLLGPLVAGAAVADTIGGIVTSTGEDAISVIGAGLLAAVAWNTTTWALGLPSSSGHALVGGLVGAGLVAGGAIHWHNVLLTLFALAVSPLLGALVALVGIRLLRRGARRATRRWRLPVLASEWPMSAALAFSHGSNDAQKSVGVIAAILAAGGHAPAGWATPACALALTAGTAVGGWRIVNTVGRRIYRIQPLDAVASQSTSAGVILGASLLGAPVSTTQVVASSVLGVGGGRRRWRHVNWLIVRHMALGWVVTLPACAVLAAVALAGWRAVA